MKLLACVVALAITGCAMMPGPLSSVRNLQGQICGLQ